MELFDNEFYEIINPSTSQTEVWTGERIKAFQVNYRTGIKMKPEEPPVKSRRTSKKRK